MRRRLCAVALASDLFFKSDHPAALRGSVLEFDLDENDPVGVGPHCVGEAGLTGVGRTRDLGDRARRAIRRRHSRQRPPAPPRSCSTRSRITPCGLWGGVVMFWPFLFVPNRWVTNLVSHHGGVSAEPTARAVLLCAFWCLPSLLVPGQAPSLVISALSNRSPRLMTQCLSNRGALALPLRATPGCVPAVAPSALVSPLPSLFARC